MGEFISYCRAPVFLHTIILVCSIHPGFTHIQAHRHAVTSCTLTNFSLIEPLYLCLISMQRGVPVPMRQVYPYELNACNPNLTPDTQMHRSSCPWNQVEHLNRSIYFFLFLLHFQSFFSLLSVFLSCCDFLPALQYEFLCMVTENNTLFSALRCTSLTAQNKILAIIVDYAFQSRVIYPFLYLSRNWN